MAHTEKEKLARWQKKLENQLLGKTFHTFYHMFCRIVCVATVIVQFALMDYYLVRHKGLLWLLWALADLIIVALFILTFIVSYRRLENMKSFIPDDSEIRRCGGEMPMTFLTWFIYSVVLCIKICVLYSLPNSIANQLREVEFFGPNMLRTAISLSSIVVYLLVLTSHNARSHSIQNDFIQSIVGSVYLDVLDTSQFLGALRDENNVLSEYKLGHVLLAIICFNFILPTEGLFVLSRKYFGKVPVSIKFQLLHKICYFIAVNLPFFSIRMVIWHLHDQNVSVFLVKNVLGIGLAIKDIHEFTIEISELVKTEIHSKHGDSMEGDTVEPAIAAEEMIMLQEKGYGNGKGEKFDECNELKVIA